MLFRAEFKTQRNSADFLDQLLSMDADQMRSHALDPRFLVAVLRPHDVSEPLVLGAAASS